MYAWSKVLNSQTPPFVLTLLNRIILTSGQCLVPIADVASIAVSGPSTGRLGSDFVDVNVRQSAVCLVSVQLASVHTAPHDDCMFVYNILLRCQL